MNKIQENTVENYLVKAEILLSSIQLSKKTILDIHMEKQHQTFEIEPDAEAAFYGLIEDQLKDFFKNLRMCLLSFEHAPFLYERNEEDVQGEVIINKEEFVKVGEYLEAIILELGGSYSAEIEELIYAAIEDEEELELIELLKEQKDFLDTLTERMIDVLGNIINFADIDYSMED